MSPLLHYCITPFLPCLVSCLTVLAGQMDNTVVVNDYSQMDRVLREERDYILNMCKTIKKAGCNVVLVQKSILRSACLSVCMYVWLAGLLAGCPCLSVCLSGRLAG